MGAWRKPPGWKRQRVRRLLERDGANCWLCNRPLWKRVSKPAKRTSLEHLRPRSAGGSDALDNLVLCHEACNRHLRDHSEEKKRKIRAKWHAETARVLARSKRVLQPLRHMPGERMIEA